MVQRVVVIAGAYPCNELDHLDKDVERHVLWDDHFLAAGKQCLSDHPQSVVGSDVALSFDAHHVHPDSIGSVTQRGEGRGGDSPDQPVERLQSCAMLLRLAVFL